MRVNIYSHQSLFCKGEKYYERRKKINENCNIQKVIR